LVVLTFLLTGGFFLRKLLLIFFLAQAREPIPNSGDI